MTVVELPPLDVVPVVASLVVAAPPLLATVPAPPAPEPVVLSDAPLVADEVPDPPAPTVLTLVIPVLDSPRVVPVSLVAPPELVPFDVLPVVEASLPEAALVALCAEGLPDDAGGASPEQPAWATEQAELAQMSKKSRFMGKRTQALAQRSMNIHALDPRGPGGGPGFDMALARRAACLAHETP